MTPALIVYTLGFLSFRASSSLGGLAGIRTRNMQLRGLPCCPLHYGTVSFSNSISCGTHGFARELQDLFFDVLLILCIVDVCD